MTFPFVVQRGNTSSGGIAQHANNVRLVYCMRLKWTRELSSDAIISESTRAVAPQIQQAESPQRIVCKQHTARVARTAIATVQTRSGETEQTPAQRPAPPHHVGTSPHAPQICPAGVLTKLTGGPRHMNKLGGARIERRSRSRVARNNMTYRSSHQSSLSFECGLLSSMPQSMTTPPSIVRPWHVV